MKTRSFFAAALALAFCACAGDAPPADEAETAAAGDTVAAAAPSVIDEFTPVDTTQMQHTASGLFMQDVREGTGAPLVAGQTAVVHYTGWFPDGTKFDSSRDRGEPFEVVQVGQAPVILAWNEGLLGMKVGGVRKLLVAPELGYSIGGMPPVIPPNATLVFLIELLQIK